jgi:hypothetical protein
MTNALRSRLPLATFQRRPQCPHPSLRKVVLAVVCLLPLRYATPTRADSAAPPTDYVKSSANGQFELVMLPKSRFVRKKPELRKRYKQSGLYRKGMPGRPLWTIDWFAWNVYPASDGHHLVRMGPWASSEEDLAVAFYRDGRLLREWKINELVKDPQSLPHSVSHFEWRQSISFNDAKRLLRLTTLANEKYLFDENGSLLEGRVVPPYQPKNLADGFLHKGDVKGLLELGPAAFPEIVAAASDGAGSRQEVAFIVLCANGKSSLPEIERLSHDTRTGVRVLAATALQEISAVEGKPILLELLQDKEPPVRIAAIAGLIEIHEDVPESEAIQEATKMLRFGTVEEKRNLLFALQRYRVPALVPLVLPLVESRGRADNDAMSLAERARYWLGVTTFQNFDDVNVGSNGSQKLSLAWSTWWKQSSTLSSDAWYAQAIERDLALLTKGKSPEATKHLEQLTGQSFGSMEGTSYNTAPQWKAWWQSQKDRRPGQIVIRSLVNASERTSSASFEVIQELVALTDQRDLAGLTGLYSTLPNWQRAYVEKALRRITNVDSFGINLGGEAKQKAVIQAWKKWDT